MTALSPEFQHWQPKATTTASSRAVAASRPCIIGDLHIKVQQGLEGLAAFSMCRFSITEPGSNAACTWFAPVGSRCWPCSSGERRRHAAGCRSLVCSCQNIVAMSETYKHIRLQHSCRHQVVPGQSLLLAPEPLVLCGDNWTQPGWTDLIGPCEGVTASSCIVELGVHQEGAACWDGGGRGEHPQVGGVAAG